MIAADTSAWIDYSRGQNTKAALALQQALQQGTLVMPPLVLVEILSGPQITPAAEKYIQLLPRLEVGAGYWERTALMRRVLLRKGLRARLGDCLIAQSCIDHETVLITGDADFRHFAGFGLLLST